jgi:hypothetical protein
MEQAGIARKARCDCGRFRRQRLDRDIAGQIQFGPHPIGLSVGSGIVEQRADRGPGIGAIGGVRRHELPADAEELDIARLQRLDFGQLIGLRPSGCRSDQRESQNERCAKPHQLLSAAAVSCASASASAS